jgi:hypothetical protein
LIEMLAECPSHAVTVAMGKCSISSVALEDRMLTNVLAQGIRPARE